MKYHEDQLCVLHSTTDLCFSVELAFHTDINERRYRLRLCTGKVDKSDFLITPQNHTVLRRFAIRGYP